MIGGVPYEIVERMSDDMTSIEAVATLAAYMAIVESASEPIATRLTRRDGRGLRQSCARPLIRRYARGPLSAPEEDETARVVVVNQALARALWGRDDVVGERLPPGDRFADQGAEVIGVLADLSVARHRHWSGFADHFRERGTGAPSSPNAVALADASVV
jgi:hypothetical protein